MFLHSFSVSRFHSRTLLQATLALSLVALADLGGLEAMPPKGAKTPGCHIAMCISILGAFGVSAQFGPLQLYSLDPPVISRLSSWLLNKTV